jgi:hypothetical protein
MQFGNIDAILINGYINERMDGASWESSTVWLLENMEAQQVLGLLPTKQTS